MIRKIIFVFALICLSGVSFAATYPNADFSVAVNNYPDHNDYSKSVNIDGWVNMYKVTKANGIYSGTLVETKRAYSNSGAVFSVPYAYDYSPSYMVVFRGYKSYSNAVAEKTLSPTTVPYKHINYRYTSGSDYSLCQDGYGTSSCASSLSTPYMDQTTTPSIICTDSDGNNIYKKGMTKEILPHVTYDFPDKCDGPSKVIEYTCPNSNSNVYVNTINCPTGYSCSDGACIKGTQTTYTCSENDGGSNYYKKGTTYGTHYVSKKTGAFTDSCTIIKAGAETYSSKYIKEFFCKESDGYVYMYYDECPSGYSCSDGACKTSSTQSGETITVTTQPAASGISIQLISPYGTTLKYATTDSNGKATFTIAEGTSFYLYSPSGYTDQWRANFGYHPALERLEYKNGAPKLIRLHDQASMSKPFNFIMEKPKVTDKSCTDSDGTNIYKSSKIYYSSSYVSNDFSDFCFDSDTVIEEQCFGKTPGYKAYDCPSGYKCSSGACVSSTPTTTCSGPDGYYNIYSKYSTTYTSGTSKNTYSDYCVNSESVMKYWCSGNTLKTTQTGCPNGYSCSSGACIKKTSTQPSIICSDSDGNNIYKKGITKEILPHVTYDHPDYCVGGARVVEHTCPDVNKNLYVNTINCPTGYVCSDGACIQKQNQISCKGRMGGYDLSIKSSISYYDGTTTNSYTDECTTKDYVRKYWCDGDSFNSKVVECPSGQCSNGICVGSTSPTTCTDSDGTNIYSKGTATGWDYYKKQIITSSDYCAKTSSGAETFSGPYVVEETCLSDGRLSAHYYECPSGYTCSDGACVTTGVAPPINITEPKLTKTIYFEPGWNLFSIPFTDSTQTTSCQDFSVSDMWHYNSSKGVYENPSKLEPGFGYWYYTDSRCSLSLSGSVFRMENKLLSGWNHIGSSSTSISFENAKGTCEIVKGPWKFNAKEYRYERARTIEPGEAYFVKVKSDCQFTSKPPPPPLPN
jgi:hypothetical protein